jgi:hypothetical protein
MANEITQSIVHISKRSSGFVLVTLGFATIYALVGVSGIRNQEASLPVYLGLGFAFVLALAGIVMMFLELKAQGREAVNIGSSPAETADLEHAVSQLSKNYDILRRQATQGFILAGTFMALGICVILAGAVGDMFGFARQGLNLTTVAGIVIEVVSGLGLYLFDKTFKELNTTSERLHKTWRILAAFKKAEALPEERKAEALISLIGKLTE